MASATGRSHDRMTVSISAASAASSSPADVGTSAPSFGPTSRSRLLPDPSAGAGHDLRAIVGMGRRQDDDILVGAGHGPSPRRPIRIGRTSRGDSPLAGLVAEHCSAQPGRCGEGVCKGGGWAPLHAARCGDSELPATRPTLALAAGTLLLGVADIPRPRHARPSGQGRLPSSAVPHTRVKRCPIQ